MMVGLLWIVLEWTLLELKKVERMAGSWLLGVAED